MTARFFGAICCLALAASPARSNNIQFLPGTWISPSSDLPIEIEKEAKGWFALILPNFGFAHIYLSDGRKGSNIKVIAGPGTCYYYMTIAAQASMKWSLRENAPNGYCPPSVDFQRKP